MSKHATLAEIVLLPSESLEDLATTLESITAVLPKASIHVVRPGIPGVDAIADLVGGSGLQLIDVSAEAGFDALLRRIDRRFGQRRWCWLFAGEVIDGAHASTLSNGGQLAMPTTFAWLERPSPLAAPRVRSDGLVVKTSRRGELAPFLPTASWRACFLREIRAAISSYAEMYEDVCLLAHLGELDAAYQRAEQSWVPAEGADKLRLARAASLLSLMTGVGSTSIPACAHWLSVEPKPYVALAYVRLALGTVPFTLIDRLLDLLPAVGPVVYRDGLAVEPYEHIVSLRHQVERERFAAKLRRDSILRMMRAGLATPGEIGHAISVSGVLGMDPAAVVRELPDGEQNPMLSDCVNVNLDADFVAEVIAAMVARFQGQAWLSQLVQRFVLARNVDAALALDRHGVTGFDHWSHLANAAWVPDTVRSKAAVRAAVHGEMDPTEAARRAEVLDDADREILAALTTEAVA